MRSMKRWASTDIRLTISPTVDLRLAALVITRDWGGGDGFCSTDISVITLVTLSVSGENGDCTKRELRMRDTLWKNLPLAGGYSQSVSSLSLGLWFPP